MMNAVSLSGVLAVCAAGSVGAGTVQFEKPKRLMAGGESIQVESPGYAAPCWADMDGDGEKDLLVGQFKGGKIRVFKNLGKGKFGKGEWLQAEGAIAEVPGVW
jgi:hypothetical protein